MRIDPSTGNLATKRSSEIITEVFKAGNEPDGISRVLDGGYPGDWKLGDRLQLKLNPPLQGVAREFINHYI